MARTGSLKWGITEVECVRNVPSPIDNADRFWEHPPWAAPASRLPSLRSTGAIVAPALVLAFRFQCTSPQPSRRCTRAPPQVSVLQRNLPRFPTNSDTLSSFFLAVRRVQVSHMPSSAGSSASVEGSPGEDVARGDCRVCALGTRPPSVPPPLDIELPSVDDPQASVASILVDAHGFEHEAATLRARFELAAAYNAGLAAHASVLHDRNHALLRRAREGFELGASTVNRLHDQVEALERENTRREDEAARLHGRAGRADGLETRCRVQEQAATEHIHQLQDELAAARAENSRLSARLTLATSPPTAPTVSSTVPRHFRDELARARADAASLQATLSAVNAELGAATSARDQASTAVV
ncbi:unnamed protein product [Phytophthora fragariaefolia]|uniref:Unnamed protein product n=1 Tax=Phytophthora fragariaefolia TaxID=1490495 RepID=A0A9W6TR63_9STRA|nr:unnamed protein product [Phytophthora fragariaefolia]